MNEINTKELGIFEIFSIGWALFRDNFIQFFKITVILGLPLSILLAFFKNRCYNPYHLETDLVSEF